MRKIFTMIAAAVCSLTAFAQSNLLSNPDDGSVVTELSQVELICGNPRYSYVEVLTKDEITVTKDGNPFCGVDARDSYPTVTLSLLTPATEDGVYVITLPENSWCLGGSETEPEYTATTTLTFTIGGGGSQSDMNVAITPEPGTQVTAPFNTIKMSSLNPSYPIVSALSASEIKVYKGETEFCGIEAYEETDGTLTIVFDQEIDENGIYTVKIPEYALVITTSEYYPEEPVPATDLIYNVVGAADKASLVVSPAPGVLTEPLSTLTVTSGLPSYPSVEINTIDDIKVLKEGVEFCGVRQVYGAGPDLTLSLTEEVTESGQYTVVFPADAWYLGNFSDENNPQEIAGVDQEFVYDVEIGGPKFNITFLPTRLDPNSEYDQPVSLDPDGPYNGMVSEFSLRVDGELALNPNCQEKVNVSCKRAGYNSDATVTADEPKQNFYGGVSTTFHFAIQPGITTNGTYTITVPKGLLGDAAFVADQNSGCANQAATFEVLFIEGLPEPEPTVIYDLGIKSSKPAEGVVDMESFVWEVTTFGIDAQYDMAPGVTKEATLTCESAGYSQSGEISLSMLTDYTRTLKFINGTEPTKNGTYVLTIPEGTFGDAEWQADPASGHTNPEIKVYFLVKNAQGDVNTTYDVEIASTTPADGSTVDISSNPLEVSFTANGEYGYYPCMKINLECAGAEYYGTAKVTSAEVADGVTTFTATLSAPVTVNGEYTMSLPEGLIGDSDYISNWTTGHGSKAATVTFTVTGGTDQPEPIKYDLEPTVTPENGSQLSVGVPVVITFVFPAGTIPATENARASLECSTANYFETALFTKGEADGTYLLQFGTNPKREGTYLLSIKEGTFVSADGAHANPQLDLSWEVIDSAIQSILNDEDIEGGVYDLNGVYVGESLENLPAGIYLVKGHKVAVTK